jgi:hypothetical protein
MWYASNGNSFNGPDRKLPYYFQPTIARPGRVPFAA